MICLARPALAEKRIYIACDDHTDYFWTAGEEAYREAFIRMIDYYLARADATAGLPAEHQARFACDGSYWMWEYRRNKTEEQFRRFMDRVRDGHISVPLNALSLSQGGSPAEAVLRGMYFCGKIERAYNVKFPLAYSIENPTYPLGLGALWAGAGARYSWAGNYGGDTVIPHAQLANREHEIYWWVGLDGSRLLVKWNSLVNGAHMGGYAEARDPAGIVEYVSADAEFRKKYPYDIIGCFGKGWDDLQTLTDEFERVAREKTTSGRKVIVSDEADFFGDFEAVYGGSLPSVTASFGNEWDLYPATISEVSARLKRAVEKLRAAEAMAALVCLRNPGFMDGREEARDRAHINFGLYFEHDFNMLGQDSSARLAFQRRLVEEIEFYVNALFRDAAAALGALIEKPGAEERFFVFNPLGWRRTDYADFEYSGAGPAHVADAATGEETPSQFVTVGGRRYLRVLARDVPPAGYKVFEIRAGAGAAYEAAAVVNGAVIENAYYRITVSERGAITSLIDKTRGNEELAREFAGCRINDLGPSAGSLVVENAGPVSVTLAAEAALPVAHSSRITLFRDSKRIDISNEILQNFDDVLAWSFGFNMDSPDVRHEECGAVLRARHVDDGGHYARRCSRVDWLTINHFADMSSGGRGVTLSNRDCFFMKLGESTAGGLDVETPRIRVLAGGRVGGNSGSGIRNQGGDSRFLQRFALFVHGGYDRAEAMRFALEHSNPLAAAAVTGVEPFYPANSCSAAFVSEPDVLLWALKPAEDGAAAAGIVARVWNLGAGQKSFILSSPLGKIRAAKRMTHLETPAGDAAAEGGAVLAGIRENEMLTFSFLLER